MRLLLSKNSKKELFDFLLEKNNCNSLKQLSSKLRISFKTIQDWRYNSARYIPGEIIPSDYSNIEILDKQENNWGRQKGGKKTIKIILEKYGAEEIKKRQIAGARKTQLISLQKYSKVANPNTKKINEKKSIKRTNPTKLTIYHKNIPDIELDLTNPLFLEFYGVLLGDGWLSKWNYKGKLVTSIGISGNANKDREFFIYLKNNIKELFNRKAYLKERPKYNSIELIFSHRLLLEKMHQELGFPIGQKVDLKIDEKIYCQGFEKVKHVVRGILDTDGCTYFDKTPVGRPYPCISIKMKSPLLIKQLADILLQEGFKVQYNIKNTPTEQIRLKGSKQLKKWISEIGSSNPRNLSKLASVAQPGLEHRRPKAGVAGSNPVGSVLT